MRAVWDGRRNFEPRTDDGLGHLSWHHKFDPQSRIGIVPGSHKRRIFGGIEFRTRNLPSGHRVPYSNILSPWIPSNMGTRSGPTQCGDSRFPWGHNNDNAAWLTGPSPMTGQAVVA
ncbi:hypothetical protein AVEN_147830-1 [Araneus ventricosus]|uniref:Uncharacterized protein n=1 Tax=Araneus ventricosus TaxID=182803 RepID=A0A4Y2CT74_ARAVE|nr:hypothetical protein AVEN_147830-1 [Araneus ventricosus]